MGSKILILNNVDMCGGERNIDEKQISRTQDVIQYKDLAIIILQGDIQQEKADALCKQV